MAMEVVWTRMFTPVLKTQVYSFALIVFVYLGATLVGSLWYRRHLKKGKVWKHAVADGAAGDRGVSSHSGDRSAIVRMDLEFCACIL